jgi:hypothetical protein
MKMTVDLDMVVVHNNHSLMFDYDQNNKMEVNHVYQVLEYNVDEINVMEEMVAAVDVVKQTIQMLIDWLIFDLNVGLMISWYRRIIISKGFYE